VLASHTNRQIHVIGHTDDVPIRRRFVSNWELSTARATAAVRFLQEKAAVDPTRLGALGYGEFHPVAPNTSAEGRAKNRRIEIVVLPEELALPAIKSIVDAN
jgi:chemotaxis protein MotB